MITLHRAGKDEVQVLQELNDEVFIDNYKYDPDLDMEWAMGEKGKAYFTDLVNNPEALCLIAEDGDKKVGYIAAAPHKLSYRKTRYIEVENMGVIPGYRSRGIGTKLMDKCLSWAKENGFQKAYVESYFDNRRAIEFYKRSGFSGIDLMMVKDL